LCHGLRRIPYGYQVTEADLLVISLMEDRGKYECKMCGMTE